MAGRHAIAAINTAARHRAQYVIRVAEERNEDSMKQTPRVKANAERLYNMSFASLYPSYLAKAKKKGRTKDEVNAIIHWLTGYTQKQLEVQMRKQTDLRTLFKEAPRLHPFRKHITGVICGVRIEEIQNPLMREIRYLDKLIDELARGKSMEKILRKV